jgi:biopolymer transport protein ExbD
MRVLQFSCVSLILLVACSPPKSDENACNAGDAGACDELAARYTARTTTICIASDSGAPACAKYRAVPLDMPKMATSGEIPTVFSVVLATDGTTQVDGRIVPNDDAILALAKNAHTRNEDLRAVIKADASVSHGRVIHVLDLLKKAGISKIAFGVSPGLAVP